MPKLIAALIRHGDYHQLPNTPSAHQPFALTDTGITQAAQAADALRHYVQQEALKLHYEVDCSRLLRSWQTARIIADKLHDVLTSLRLNEFDELAERGLGSAANLTIEQIENIISHDPRYERLPQDWKSSSHFRLPLQGAESLIDAGERVAQHLRNRMQTLAEHTPHDSMQIFVGHGAAFRHAAYHLGVLEFDDIARLSMYHAQPVYLEYRADKNQWLHIAGQWKQRTTHSEYSD